MKKVFFLFAFAFILVCATNAQNYFLNGNATFIGGDCYQLTASQGNQNGTVWYGNQINLLQPFDLQFIMNLGSLDANGADGMCFVLQTVGTSAIGASGGGMGYLNFGTSFGIEFDTWQNAEYGDPVYDHIAMEYNGDINHNTPYGNVAGPVQMNILGLNTEDGDDHTVRITWNPDTHVCEVYFDCIFRLAGTIDLVNTVFNGQNLVYFGFTAATGGAWNTQVVCLQENIIAVGADVTICTGASTTLSVAGNTQGTYEWTPSDYLDDPNSSSPVANPPTTTTYTVTFSDLCGNTISDEVTVHVTDLELDVPGTVELSCSDPDALIVTSTNFFNNIDYTWTTDNGSIVGNPNSANVTVDAPGTYTIVANYQDLCIDEEQVIVTGDYSDFLIAGSVSNSLDCIDSTATLVCDSNFDDGVVYTWNTIDGNIISNTNSPSITVNAPGTYFGQIYLNEFCNAGIELVVTANFETYTADAGENVELNCYNPSIHLQGYGNGPGASIQWTTLNGNIVSGSTVLNPVVDEPGVYTLTIIHPDSGCDSQDQVSVTADFSAPSVVIGPQDVLTCIVPVVVISEFTVSPQDADYTYQWSTTDGSIVNFSNTSGMASVNSAGTYILQATSLDNGCSGTGEVQISESEDFLLDLSQLRFPNIISPNGDAKNSRWLPFLANDPKFYTPSLFDEYSLRIYNRWGVLVFENTSSLDYWDANDVETGTYFYMVHYSTQCGEGATGDIEGTIEVVR